MGGFREIGGLTGSVPACYGSSLGSNPYLYHSKTTNHRPKQRSSQHTKKKQYRVQGSSKMSRKSDGKIFRPGQKFTDPNGSESITLPQPRKKEEKEKTANTVQVFRIQE